MCIKLIEAQVLRKCAVKLARYYLNYYIVLCLVLVIFFLNWTGSPMSAGTISRLFAALVPRGKPGPVHREMIKKFINEWMMKLGLSGLVTCLW